MLEASTATEASEKTPIKQPLIGVHFSAESPFIEEQSEENRLQNRGDTLLMPNGSMGVLLSCAKKLGIDCTVYDTTFPSEEESIHAIEQQIEGYIEQGLQPRIFISLLSYNAEASLKFMRAMKQRYGDKIVTGVGGQLTGRAQEAYAENPDIDVLGIGDAELILEPMMRKYETEKPSEVRTRIESVQRDRRQVIAHLMEHKKVEQWIADNNRQAAEALAAERPELRGKKYKQLRQMVGFEPMLYELPDFDPQRYAFIRERTQEMPRVAIGPKENQLTNMVMLTTEFGRQCDWAHCNKDGACTFCALIGVEDDRNFQPVHRYVAHLVEMKRQHPQMNWVFDVSNQLLEQNRSEAIAFLEELAQERAKYPEVSDVKTYAYLTVNNVTAKSAPLLKQCGIELVYVGLESFDPHQWRSLNKPNAENNVRACLEAARDNGIKIRTSLVLGSNTSAESLQKEIHGLRLALEQYPNVFLTIGFHKVEIIPGSRDFEDFEIENEWLYCDAQIKEAYEHFFANGFLTREHQIALTHGFIEWRSIVNALVEQDEEFKREFKEFVKRATIQKEQSRSLLSVIDANLESARQTIVTKIAAAREKGLGVTYEQVDATIHELNQIARTHGVAGYTIEHGSVTGIDDL